MIRKFNYTGRKKIKRPDVRIDLLRNKSGARYFNAYLNLEGISSDLEQSQREEVLLKFRSKQTRVLVATDVLSRGIDIKDINFVINYDVPGDAEDYVHRIGRTARADTKGVALTLVNEDDMYKLDRIEQLIERKIQRVRLPEALGDGPEWSVRPFNNKGGRPFNKGKKKNFKKK